MPNAIAPSANWHSAPGEVHNAIAQLLDPRTRSAMRLACHSMLRAVELDCMEVLVSNHAVLADIIGNQRYHAVQKIRIFGEALQHVALLHKLPARIRSLAIYGCPSKSWIVPPTVKFLSLYPCFDKACEHTQTAQQTSSCLTGNVQFLHLENRRIDQKSTDLLAFCTNIKGLSLLSANVSDHGASSISKMPTLYALSLDSNPIGILGIKELLTNISLTSLSLSNISALRNRKTMKALAKIPSLTSLRLNDDGLISADATNLSKSTTIRCLSLQRNMIDERGASALISNKIRETLDLDGNPIHEICLKPGVKNKQLRSLGMTDIGSEHTAIIEIVHKCRALERLRLEVKDLKANFLGYLWDSPINEIKFTGLRLGTRIVEKLVWVPETCRFDYAVDTTRPFFVSSARQFAILSMARNYHRIEYLSLYSREITDEHLRALPTALTKLELLACHSVSEAGIEHLVSRPLALLRLLCLPINDLGAYKLVAGKIPAKLQIIDGHIGPDGVSALAQCRDLKVLQIMSKLMDESVLRALLAATHQRQVLYVNHHKLVGLDQNGIVAELVPIKPQKRTHSMAFPGEGKADYPNSPSEKEYYPLNFTDIPNYLHPAQAYHMEKIEGAEMMFDSHEHYEDIRLSTNYLFIKNIALVGDDFHAGHIHQLPPMLHTLALINCRNIDPYAWGFLSTLQISSLVLDNIDIESDKFRIFIETIAKIGPTPTRQVLTHLTLKNVSVNYMLALTIARNGNVTSLALESLALPAVVAEALATSKTLTELSLTNVPLDINNVVALSNISTLSKLTVAGAGILPMYVRHFSRKPSLTSSVLKHEKIEIG